MRYWLLTTEYPPHYGGGISTYCFYTARMLQRNGHEVTVFIYDLSIQDDVLTHQDGIRVVRFLPRKTGTHHFLGFNAYISYEYANIVRLYMQAEGSPDIIESQEYHGIAYYLQQFCLLEYEAFKGLNIVITCHAPAFLCLEYNHVPVNRFPDYWTGQMERSSMRSAGLLISPSRYFIEQARQRMSFTGVEEKYLVNPIEVLDQPLPRGFEQNRIVCLGKLSPLKGSFELIALFKELWDNGFEHALHIIGSTRLFFHPEASTMGDLVKKKYGKYIQKQLLVLHGEMVPEIARQELASAHVVIVPSILDNLPYTVLEAMGAGKVVLASIQGGQKEVIINNENGFLFDHGTKGDFKSQLLHILQLDRQAINRIGTAAIQTIRTCYSPDVVYKQKMSLIEAFRKSGDRTLFPFITDLQGRVRAAGQQGLLSIVIPYYNMGAYIESCVQSIVASDYQWKEIIIVDDGSADESVHILGSLEANYPVKIFRKTNEGLPLTRNFGAERAQGEYLAFLDADDQVEKSYYSKAVAVLKKYENVHFAGCWTRYFGNAAGHWPCFNPEPPYLLVHNMINSSALVYKRESFLRSGRNDEKFVYGMEDWDSVIGMVEHGYGGVALPEPLFNYRVRKDSMARAFTRVKQLYLNSLIAKKHERLYNQYGSDIANLLNANGSGIDFDNPTFDPPGQLSFISPSRKWVVKAKEKVKQHKHLRALAYILYKKINK